MKAGKALSAHWHLEELPRAEPSLLSSCTPDYAVLHDSSCSAGICQVLSAPSTLLGELTRKDQDTSSGSVVLNSHHEHEARSNPVVELLDSSLLAPPDLLKFCCLIRI